MISIIGLLASIVLASLANAREKAIDAAALEAAHGVIPGAFDCISSDNNLDISNGYICDSGTWHMPLPDLPGGWTWIDNTTIPGGGEPSGTILILQKDLECNGVWCLADYLFCTESGSCTITNNYRYPA